MEHTAGESSARVATIVLHITRQGDTTVVQGRDDLGRINLMSFAALDRAACEAIGRFVIDTLNE